MEIQGNSDVYGAVVGRVVDWHGNPQVHDDRALASLGFAGTDAPPERIYGLDLTPLR